MDIALTPIHAVVVALSKGELPNFVGCGEGWSAQDFADELQKIYDWDNTAQETWFTLFASKVGDFSKGTAVFQILPHALAQKMGIAVVRGRGVYFSLTLGNGLTKYGHLGPYSPPVRYITPPAQKTGA